MADFSVLRLWPGAFSSSLPVPDWPASWLDEDGVLRQGTLKQFAENLRERADRTPVRALISAADALLSEVRLTRKQARHLQRVLPFLLEETVLQSAEELWFGWGKPDRDKYPVVGCDRAALEHFYHWCREQGLALASLSCDAALLRPLAPLRWLDGDRALLMPTADNALVVESSQQADVLAALGKGEEDLSDWTYFDDEQAVLEQCAAHWRRGGPVELLHGAYPPRSGRREASARSPWRPLATFAAGVALVACLLFVVEGWRYDRAADDALAAAANAYGKLFPEDRAVMNVSTLRGQFRGQLASLGGASGTDAGFLALMTPLGNVLAQQPAEKLSPVRIQYNQREGALTLDIKADSFDVLQGLRTALIAAGLKAEIADARNDGKGVTARLKVEQS